MRAREIVWIVVVVLLVALSGYFYYQQTQIRSLLRQSNEQLMEANLEVGRAKTTITDQKKIHEVAISSLREELVQEINGRNAIISSYGELEALYRAEKKKVKLVTKVLYKDKELSIPKGKLFYADDAGDYLPVDSLTFNYEDFRITIQGDAVKETLDYKLHQRFSAQFLAAKLPNGGVNHYAQLFEIDDNNQKVNKLELVSFEVLQSDQLPNRFSWLNPKLDIMLGLGINSGLGVSWVGDIGLSLSSYGKTPNDIMWRFGRIGTGMTKHGFSLSFSPAQFNLGSTLPIISNLWVSPYGGFDFGSSLPHFGVGIGVVF